MDIVTNQLDADETEVKTIEKLIELASEYLPKEQAENLAQVYQFSKNAHEGQIRRSGEPYISHPLGVTGILARLQLDYASLATGLLHDTVEDTEVELKDIDDNFGETVAALVDGVTKISQMNFKNTHEKQGENIRKMILAMGRDIRVVLVKLCDRLHNMRTLTHMPPEKQSRIAQETLDIYAPLASRLGINWLKVELEDLSFRFSLPEAYYELAQKVQKKRKERDKFIDDFKKHLSNELSQRFKGSFEVQGRSKHLYSIHKKMTVGNLDYDQIYDVLAFRVVVRSIPECYEVLGHIHSVWRPIPGRFKDFIAMPKANNYQSLHTTVIGPGGDRIEIQIRTDDMHLIAEEGIAAHWSYKEGGADTGVLDRFKWLRELVSIHQQAENSGEFLEDVKADLFDTEIYVFTPKGEVKEFPDGATPIDFAYAVHTDVGYHCTGARVNGKMVPLKYKLRNGDFVEVITSKNQAPSKDWLNYCVTTKARSKIRYHVKLEQRKRALEIGKGIFEKALRKHNYTVQSIQKKQPALFESMLKELGCHSLDELYIQLGYGKVYPNQISDKIAPAVPEEPVKEGFLQRAVKTATSKSKKSSSLIVVEGMSDILVRFARCCNPIPGDPIAGFISRGRGITVHRSDCQKAFELDPDRQVDVQWGKSAQDAERLVRIRITAGDNKGLLVRLSEIFLSKGINIQSAQIRATRDKKALCLFDVNIKNTTELHQVLHEIRKLKDVIDVVRG